MPQILIPQHEAVLILGSLRATLRETSRRKKQASFNALAKACKALNLVQGKITFIGEVLDSAGEAHLLVMDENNKVI